MACYFPKFHYFLCIILKPKPTQLCRSASPIKRWTAGGLFCCALCLFKTVTQLNVECFLTLWFLPDLLSSAVRSKVVKGQRTYRLFAGALPWTEKIFFIDCWFPLHQSFSTGGLRSCLIGVAAFSCFRNGFYYNVISDCVNCVKVCYIAFQSIFTPKCKL